MRSCEPSSGDERTDHSSPPSQKRISGAGDGDRERQLEKSNNEVNPEIADVESSSPASPLVCQSERQDVPSNLVEQSHPNKGPNSTAKNRPENGTEMRFEKDTV